MINSMALKRKSILLSFTVFAMFFGAGNLIFPAFLAFRAGENIVPAFIGFAITAIGFPVLSLLAAEKAGSLSALAGKVSKLFSLLFTVAIHLAIGPCLAIPRTSSTSFEMLKAAFSFEGLASSIIFSALFFLAAAIIALHPEKLSKRLGRILAPILILLIIILFAGTICIDLNSTSALDEWASSPFSTGFKEGYQTMDAVAGLAFGSVLIINIQALGIKKEDEMKEGVKAAIGGGIFLLFIYALLAVIGMKANAFAPDAKTGADILSAAAWWISPTVGRYLIAAIFLIACFNTAVGLLSSCGEYFSSIAPRISRNKWIAIFAIVSAVIANAGLSSIIAISSPVLELLYPAAITLILLAFLPGQVERHLTYILAVSVSLISSLLAMLNIPLPLSAYGFGWLLPTITAGIIGFVLDNKKPVHR